MSMLVLPRLGATVAACLLLGCVPSVRMPSVLEPIESPAWKTCAGQLADREAAGLIDDLTLDSKTLLCRGVVLAQAGQVEKSLEVLEEASVRDRTDHRAHYLKGRILAAAGRYEEALAAFDRSARLFPTLEIPTERLGREIADKSGPERAVVFLEVARERKLCPASCEAYLARLYHETRRDDRAEAIWRALVQKTPDEPTAYVGLATLVSARNDFAAEADLLAQAVLAAKFAELPAARRAEILHGRAFALYNAKRHDEAAKVIDEATALDDGHADWHVLAGWIDLARGDAAAALGSFELAGQRDPRLVAADVGRADALTALGRLVDARAVLTVARQREPGNGIIVLKLARVVALGGNKDEAARLVDEAVRLAPDNLPGELVDELNRLIGPRSATN